MKKIVKILLCTLAIGIIAVVGAGCSLKDTIKQLTCKHDYGAVATESTKAATCAEDGEELWTCLLCGKEKTETVAKLPHTFNDGVETKKATCTNAGEIVYTCTVCDAEKVEVVEKITHKEVKVESKAPTCTEDGYTEYSYCADCRQYLVPKTILKATGHEKTVITGKAATCTDTGLTNGEYCFTCGEIFAEQTEIAAKGHNIVELVGYTATCEKDGLTNGQECTRCGVVFVEQTVIPAFGHSYVENSITCDLCGEKNVTTYLAAFVADGQYTEEVAVEGELILGNVYRIYHNTSGPAMFGWTDCLLYINPNNETGLFIGSEQDIVITGDFGFVQYDNYTDFYFGESTITYFDQQDQTTHTHYCDENTVYDRLMAYDIYRLVRTA